MIEKPLLDKYLSTREKNEKFFKRSLMVSLVKPAVLNRSRREPSAGAKRHAPSTLHPDSLGSANSPPGMADERQLEQQNLVDYNLIANLDTFGLSGATAASRPTAPLQLTTPNLSPPPATHKQPLISDISMTPTSLKRVRDSPPTSITTTTTTSCGRDETSVETGGKLVKRSRSARSSDNEAYSDEDEDEDERLMIDVDKSVSMHAGNKTEPMEDDDQPKSPEVIEPIAVAKIIPLEKESKEQIAPPATTTTTTASTTSKDINDDDDDDDDEKLTLFDLIAKMQEKLGNKTASSSSAAAAVAAKPSTSIGVGSSNPIVSAVSSLMMGNAIVKSGGGGGSGCDGAVVENARGFEYVENMHDNVSYGLWTIAGFQGGRQQKASEEIRFLVRQSVDGYVNTETSSLNVAIGFLCPHKSRLTCICLIVCSNI